MTKALSTKAIRASLALVMVLSWLVFSNHCALGLMAIAPASEHACCGGQSGPADDGKSNPVRECCHFMQAVHAPVVAVAAPVLTAIEATAWLEIPASDPAHHAAQPMVRLLETGPPEARSFAEMVLQQGVRAHAPPFAA